MTTENTSPQGRPDQKAPQAQVSLAMQVAHIAAQVTTVLRSGDPEKRAALEDKLVLARDRLQRDGAPPGLVPFIEVMRGLLQDQDVSALASDLPGSYRAVYEQIVDEVKSRDEEGELTVREVLDEVAYNVILAMERGTYHQRRMMANTLLRMERESSRRPDLHSLIEFLQAAQALLQEEDVSPFEERLRGPFREKWDQVLEALVDLEK
jgi:hypothetical protein